MKVSDVGSARTSARITTAPGAWNAAWDIWVNSSPDSPGQDDDTEIVVWATTQGDPTPIGGKVETITVQGRAYEVWKDAGPGGTDVLSYVDVDTTTRPDIALAPFPEDSISRGATQAGSYVTSVQLGFEPWKGGQGLAIDDFTYSPTDQHRSFTTPARPTAGQQARDQAGNAPATTDDEADQGQAPATAPQPAALGGGQSLVGAGSERCADVAGRSTEPGAPLQLWNCQNGNTAQQWTRGQGDTLVNAGSQLCLAVDVASPTQGARIAQETCSDGAPGQQWKTTPDAALLNPATGLCLDAKNAGTANATPLIAWQCHDADNQTWTTR